MNSWITNLLIPFIILFVALLLVKFPPKEINDAYGYRTKRSMKSQESWDYANKKCGQIWLVIGLILVIGVIISKLTVPLASENLTLIHMTIEVAAIFIPIFFIEHDLKKKFD